jgi:hypothetical protein
MTFIILLLFIGCLIGGIRLWKKKRILSLLLFSPLLITTIVVGYILYQMNYHTTSNSLNLSVHKEKETYVVKGKWEDSLDAYRFPTDFIVFYVPKNVKLSEVKRERVEDYKEMDWTFLKEQVNEAIKEKSYSKWKPQIIDLRTEKQFKFTFELPKNIKENDIKVYYVHAREEPMEALEFWFKKIK